MGFLTARLASRLREKGASHGFQTLLFSRIENLSFASINECAIPFLSIDALSSVY